MTPAEFIAFMTSSAQETQQATGIPASFTIAEAAVESAWDESAQAVRDFNLFGVKADPSWHGAVAMWPTREVVDGKDVVQVCAFRKYPTLTAGLTDHANFLTSNERYKPAFQHTNDSCAFATAVAQAGYATDPHYAATIIAIIDEHNLKQFDISPTTKGKA